MSRRFIHILSSVSLLFLSIFPSQAIAQLNQLGYPFTRNYNYKEYQAPGANLAVAMNSRGVMYFANLSSVVLEYDGISWKQIAVANHSQPKSLAVDTNDIVFVGATGEIGYIAPDITGKSKYYSLTHLVDTSKVHFTNVWKTYATPKGVFFCALSHIFHFQFPDQLNVIELPKESFFSYYTDDLIITSFYKKGLLEMRDGIMVTVPGVENLIDQEVKQILPYSTHEWLLFADKGLYTYNTSEKRITFLNNTPELRKTNNILTSNWVYNACRVPNWGFAFATINKGLFISNTKVEIKECYNSQTGILSSSIYNAFYNVNQGVIWTALDNGISRLEYNSPFRVFSNESNKMGTVLSALRHNGTLYAGTLSGLFYLTYNELEIPVFKAIEELKGKFVYSIVSIPFKNRKSKLIALAGEDFYEVINNNAFPLNANASAYIAHVSKLHEGTFYAGCAKGIRKISWKNGKWNVFSIPNSGSEVYSLFEDKAGNIWASTAIDGLLKITEDNKVTVFTTKNGLPSNSDLRVYYYEKEDKVVVTSRNGIYEYNHYRNFFEKSSILHFSADSDIGGIYDGHQGSVWIIKNNRLIMASPQEQGFSIDSVTFKRLPDMSIESIYTEPNGITWICTSEGLISYNNHFEKPEPKPFYTLIRLVTNPYDSIIFGGNHYEKRIYGNDTLLIPVHTQPDFSKKELKYRDNSLTFTYASPYFNDESAIQFSYLLEGYNKTWSKWSNINRAVYTNLHEGKYTFRVKAINVFGEESEEDSYSFVILPPWYRTIWSFAAYILLAIFILFITVKLYTRKLEADKKRLEGIVKERTAEVVKQKDEILEKNIEIEHKNKEITDSIVYAKRIQEALLPVKSQLSVPNLELFVYFKPKDIVSGDFYFIRQIPEKNILIATAADCTGHGVPGAFMSMLGISFLNELMAKPDNLHSDEILNLLRLQVIASLNPKGLHYETKDGMDIALVVYNYETKQLEFSGANNPIYHISNGELNEIKADKMPIGLHERCGELFQCHKIVPNPNDIIYLFSDGFVDQFGGEKGKKYLSKNFKEFLLNIHKKPMAEQEQLIADESVRWRGCIEQIDDQIVMGIRFL